MKKFKRKTRMTRYSDKCVHEGPVTVVIGDTFLEATGEEFHDFMKLTDKVNELMYCGFDLRSKGIARLDPEDTYDEKLGKSLASFRAELKGLNKAENKLFEVKKLLEKCLLDINREVCEIVERKNSLEIPF